jgi:flavin reductase (DIM6/NTAB) family NADH-FMN oxidoreductase RutF
VHVTHTQISDRNFRDVLGHFCTGVTVITSTDDDQAVGFACQSFQSVSLDPPMVSFAPAHTSATWPRIRRSGRFVANVLAENQGDVCARFAKTGADKFADMAWRPSPSGSPILDGVTAWLDCVIVDEIQAGDHAIVLGRVLTMSADSDCRPLLFYRGGLTSLTS